MSASRLVSVLFLDIAAYSTFRNDQQLLLRQALARLIRAIPYLTQVQPGDVYIDTRAGDAAVVVFSNHVTGPVESALHLAEATRQPVEGNLRLTLRMGLHVGTAFFDEDGHAMGEALNIGQAVANAGAPGQITSSQTYVEMLGSDTDRFDALFGPERPVQLKSGKTLMVVTIGGDPVSLETNPTANSRLEMVVLAGAQVGRRIPLPHHTVELGRGDLPSPGPTRLEIAEPTISRIQGTVEFDPTSGIHTLVHNPHATNATVVNDVIVTSRALQVGDVIRAGQLALAVEAAAAGNATLRWDTHMAALDIECGSHHRRHPLAEGVTRFGRQAPCEVIVDDPAVSRVHFSIRKERGACTIVHESTTNATLINGQPLLGQRVLENGDCVQVSERTRIRFVTMPR